MNAAIRSYCVGIIIVNNSSIISHHTAGLYNVMYNVCMVYENNLFFIVPKCSLCRHNSSQYVVTVKT